MSYIPRPAAGRADEVWAQPGMGSAHYFGAEQRGSTAGSASTRSSVVRVLGEGSRGPDLPALPDGASEASTRRFSAARPVGSAVKTEAKAAVKAPGAPWSGDEIATLADASVGFWRSGRVVDVAAVGGGLGRTSSDVSAMLEYLLVGYVRFGPTACWGSESRQLVREWAAAQFPRNEHLNAGSSVAAPARRDTWLAALTCRPRTRPRAASVYGVADHHSATSGQNIVADFREGLQAKEAEAPPGLAPAHRRSRSAASMPQAVVPPPVPVPTPVPVPVPAAPVFTGGLRARPAPSTLSRTSRSRRLRSAPGASTTLPRASSTPQASEAPPSSLPVPDVLPSPAFSDAPLDAAFSDLPAETRTGIRRFVTRFMADFPTDFRQRVEAQRAGRSGLCLTVDNYADFRYGDDAFLKAIETVYRTVGGSMVYTCNLFFHVQLLHAIRLDRIAVADDTWLRANEFATRVFNGFIERGDTASPTATATAAGSNTNSSTTATNNANTTSLSIADSSPFERAFFLDQLARRYVRFISDNSADEIAARVAAHGPRPMPVALQPSEGAVLLPFDAEARNTVIGFIWEDIPHATLRSKETALLRALELLNAELAARCALDDAALHALLDLSHNEDSDADSDADIDIGADIHTDPLLARVPPPRLAIVVGTAFARRFFADGGARAVLPAMLHDHPFRPVPRDEMREWLARAASPFGNDVDFQLNSALHAFVKRLRLRPSSRQWLATSAAATLSMLRRTHAATKDKWLLAHIDIDAYTARFRDIVRESVNPTDGPADGPASPRLSAFANPPAWVSLLTDTRRDSQPPAVDNNAHHKDSQLQAHPQSQPQSQSQSQPQSQPQPQPSLGMVLQKFEEMREMIQQMQLQKNQ